MVCLASSQGCPRHASNAGCNSWMKLPGSKQGFSSCPAVTRIASSTSSLKLRPPYCGVHSSPGRLRLLPRELGTLPQYRSVVHGEERASIGAALAQAAAHILPTEAVICVQNLTQFRSLPASQEKHCGVSRRRLHNS